MKTSQGQLYGAEYRCQTVGNVSGTVRREYPVPGTKIYILLKK